MNLTIEEKNNIYDYLSMNKDKFIYKKDRKSGILSMNNIISELIVGVEFNSFEECFNVLTEHWDKKCKNDNCDNDRKIISLFPDRQDFNSVAKKYGIFKFCNNVECNYDSISRRQIGENNTSHRMSEETFKMMCKKNSIKMKEKIKNGEFIPNITNSWAKSRCELSFIRGSETINMKTRSTWDAYFQLFNKEFLYEKIIIPYKHNGEYHNYIVDFVDVSNKILYEIKPNSTYNNSVNLSKYKFTKRWCKINGYKYIIVKNNWFKKNYNPDLLIGQPSEEKMKRNLKQFYENKKH